MPSLHLEMHRWHACLIAGWRRGEEQLLLAHAAAPASTAQLSAQSFSGSGPGTPAAPGNAHTYTESWRTAVTPHAICSVLSLDVGRRCIGLAGCDPLGITVTPLPALKRGSFEADLVVLQAHCRERNVQGLVVGLPSIKPAADGTGRALSSLWLASGSIPFPFPCLGE